MSAPMPWRSHDFEESLFSFHFYGSSREQTQVTRFAWQTRLSHLSVFLFSEAESHYIAQAGQELKAILFLQYLECWGYKHAWPHLLDRLISAEGPEIQTSGLTRAGP